MTRTNPGEQSRHYARRAMLAAGGIPTHNANGLPTVAAVVCCEAEALEAETPAGLRHEPDCPRMRRIE